MTSILISQRQTELFLVCESLKKRMIVVDSPTIAFAKKNPFEIFSSMTVFHRQVRIPTKCPQLPTDSEIKGVKSTALFNTGKTIYCLTVSSISFFQFRMTMKIWNIAGRRKLEQKFSYTTRKWLSSLSWTQLDNWSIRSIIQVSVYQLLC